MGALHTAHVVLAGIWLGSLVFTTLVVSPALKSMDWPEPQRVLVRSRIGRQFSRVATPNLLLLLGCLLAEGALRGEIGGGGRSWEFWSELSLVVVVIALSSLHGLLFGRRLSDLAARERHAAPREAAAAARSRRRLQRGSFAANLLNLVLSLAVAVLAISA